MKIEDPKFWSKTQEQPSGCILWTGAIHHTGYGKVKRRKIQKNALFAHRYAFYLKHGHFPVYNACHTCDTPNCVNTEHLFDGTHQDNSDDKYAKGRGRTSDQRGEQNGNSKLTANDKFDKTK